MCWSIRRERDGQCAGGFTPEAGEHVLSDAERDAAGPDYLMTEILQRLPVRFALRAQLAQSGDPTDDSTVR